VTAIPTAPGAEYQFQVPPNWPAPAGFDPRHGYSTDPTWPEPPDGWVFWTKPAVPVAVRASGIRGSTVARIAIGAVIAIVAIAYFVSGGSSGSSQTHIDSCWKSAGGTEYAPVDCSSPDAQYKVIQEVADFNLCPAQSDSYLDSNDVGAPDRYRCLVPVTH
jgi:hypothetical protein